jgi:hypothetical protein
VVAFVATDEHASLYWTEVKPDMSQAALTFWVPMLADFPYVLVDLVPGDHFMPSDRCRACRTGESVGDSAVDAWLGTHRQPVADLMSERVGHYRFYLRHQHLFPVIDMHGEISPGLRLDAKSSSSRRSR